MDTDQRWLRVKIAHHNGNCCFGATSLRIAFATLKSEDAEVAELSGEIGFSALSGLNPTLS